MRPPPGSTKRTETPEHPQVDRPDQPAPDAPLQQGWPTSGGHFPLIAAATPTRPTRFTRAPA